MNTLKMCLLAAIPTKIKYKFDNKKYTTSCEQIGIYHVHDILSQKCIVNPTKQNRIVYTYMPYHRLLILWRQ